MESSFKPQEVEKERAYISKHQPKVIMVCSKISFISKNLYVDYLITNQHLKLVFPLIIESNLFRILTIMTFFYFKQCQSQFHDA